MQRKLGFTLIELSLSMAFISILSLAVVLTITNTISSYRRGLTLNQVNTAGTDLVDDMTVTIQNSPVFKSEEQCQELYSGSGSGSSQSLSNCKSDGGQKLIVVKRNDGVKVGVTTIDSVPLFGAFCTGKYSYVWRSGYLINGDETNKQISVSLKYQKMKEDGSVGSEEAVKDFKLLKILDNERAVCKSAIKNNYNNEELDGAFFAGVSSEPIELIPTENGLALYDLDVAKPALGGDDRSMFYSASFIVGTLQGGINITLAGDNCATPGGFNSAVESFDYCSVNKFNFAAQAKGGQNE